MSRLTTEGGDVCPKNRRRTARNSRCSVVNVYCMICLTFRSQANLSKDLGRMLTKARRMPAEPEWRGSEADRLSDGVIGTFGRMLADRHQIDRPDMEVIG